MQISIDPSFSNNPFSKPRFHLTPFWLPALEIQLFAAFSFLLIFSWKQSSARIAVDREVEERTYDLWEYKKRQAWAATIFYHLHNLWSSSKVPVSLSIPYVVESTSRSEVLTTLTSSNFFLLWHLESFRFFFASFKRPNCVSEWDRNT